MRAFIRLASNKAETSGPWGKKRGEPERGCQGMQVQLVLTANALISNKHLQRYDIQQISLIKLFSNSPSLATTGIRNNRMN